MACAIGFFATGWLASIDSTWGLSWRQFNPTLGFGFATAFAQLVLAGVVWAQIKGANDALVHARDESAQFVARERRQRAADSIATFVGHASNASAVYSGEVLARLRDIVAHPGDTTFVDVAWGELAEANQARQAAHAESFQIRVRTSDGGPQLLAADAFLELLNRQHQCARRIIGWSMKYVSTPASALPAVNDRPDAKSIYEDAKLCRERCLDLASALLNS